MSQIEHVTNRAGYIINKLAGFTKSFADSSAKGFAAGQQASLGSRTHVQLRPSVASLQKLQA